jgi:hypothetical protein
MPAKAGIQGFDSSGFPLTRERRSGHYPRLPWRLEQTAHRGHNLSIMIAPEQIEAAVEVARWGDQPGSALYWAPREGKVVHV